MLNINVGILGHVDSGKTSLAKALSAVSSTACFDKSPQSQERGITLDLGFSAYFVDVSKDEKFSAAGVSTVQVTLVDCPGHASLIRTIMGGAQIIDMMLLVVDVTKGIQTQTAECLVVGEMLARHLVVVLNKIDMAAGETPEEKVKTVQKMEKRLRGVMTQTRWPSAPIVAVAAAPAASTAALDTEGAATPAAVASAPPSVNVEAVTSSVLKLLDVALAERKPSSSAFLMYVDHCFAVKGQGTVLTGTVLDGTVKVGDEVTLPDYQQQRRVKGLQMFRKPVAQAKQGDRIGLCITQFDASQMERGIVCGKEAHVLSTSACIAEVKKVRFHKLAVEPSHKYHITVGHSTVMGVLKFFSCPAAAAPAAIRDFFTAGVVFDYVDALPDDSAQQFMPLVEGDPPGKCASLLQSSVRYFAVVLLEAPITTVAGSTLIASRLDSDIHQNMCRLAIQGTALQLLDNPDSWRSLPVVKHKSRQIGVDRVVDAHTCIAKGLMGKQQAEGGGEQQLDVQKFVGMKVVYHYRTPAKAKAVAAAHVDPAAAAAVPQGVLPSGSPQQQQHPHFPDVEGIIEGTFGKTGKVRIVFKGPVFDRGGGAEDGGKKSKNNSSVKTPDDPSAVPGSKVVAPPRPPLGDIFMHYRRHPFALHSPMLQ
jgi:selenocysteine-specific elongation factor